MKTKVCGLREPDNIKDVLALGVDYLGFIFYEKSSRYVGDTDLAEWIEAQGTALAGVAKVGVFVNAGVDTILNTVHDYELDYVQLHGDESPGYCRELQLLWSVSTLRTAGLIRAFSVDAAFNFGTTADYADACDLFVFDTGGQAAHGGTGVKWDWSKLARYTGDTPFLLSGGIGPGDAARVRMLEHPRLLGVDLNSRFEDRPGVKDVGLLGEFVGTLGTAK